MVRGTFLDQDMTQLDLSMLDMSGFAKDKINDGPEPVRYEDGYPVYDSKQIEIFGRPEYWGVENYRVIALRETEHPMVTDWKMEQERGRMRPIHRYSRVER
jgi:hypothetical protein